MLHYDDKDVENFVTAMKEGSRYDFSNYSVSSLKRRLTKILLDSKLSVGELVETIKKDEAFAENIVKNITVCTTELFRDPEVWISLRDEVLSGLPEENILRVWHAGCSTGQEVYSMLILLNEMNLLERTELYATDINMDALDIAARGIYKYRYNLNYQENFDKVFNNATEGIRNKEKISFGKYFHIDNERDILQVRSFLIEKPVFRKIDLVKDDNPFNMKFDIIICRNVIIYFNFKLQNKVYNLFYRNLRQNGCLVMGTHENIIGTYSSFFEKRDQMYFKLSQQ